LPEGDFHTRTDSSNPLLDCDRRFKMLEARAEKVDCALFGPDGTDGIVSKISKIEIQTGFMRYLGQSVFGVMISIITIILVKVFGI